MSAPYYAQVLASQKAAGTLFNTYTTAKSVINVSELVPLPGNYLQQGSKLRVRVFGARALRTRGFRTGESGSTR